LTNFSKIIFAKFNGENYKFVLKNIKDKDEIFLTTLIKLSRDDDKVKELILKTKNAKEI